MLEQHRIETLELAAQGRLYRANYFVEGHALHIAARGVPPICLALQSDRPQDMVRVLLGKWIHEGTAEAEPAKGGADLRSTAETL
jgi:hypothetical protein